jgi:Mg2+-importing ATPase
MDYKGLSSKEAQDLFVEFGPNEAVHSKRISGLISFLLRFKNPLVLILIFAAIISAFTGDWVDSSLIVGIVIVSIFLDFINTYRSQKAAELLKEEVAVNADVMRDGIFKEVRIRMIIPGDIVRLTPGDIVPADGVTLEAKDFFVNEAALTGESFPLEKTPDAEVMMGTSVMAGEATMKVISTGAKTKFSGIAKSLTEAENPTEFDKGIKDFSILIMRITFILVIFIFFVIALLKHDVLQAFLFAMALAVGLTPELLPMIIALNLSKGSLIMAKKGVIVKKLSSIQNFGNMDVLCTDKTGTLTEDRIVLVRYIDIDGEVSESVYLNAYVSSSFRTAYKNPLDTAIKEYKKIDIKDYTKIDEIPFDYKRKRDSIVVEHEGKRFLVAKGATDEMLDSCKYSLNSKNLMNVSDKKKIVDLYENLSADGYRVLAIARKDNLSEKSAYDSNEEKDMIFLGFMAFLDPAKKDVTATLNRLEQYGIEIKILTGDNEFVTKKIASEIKLNVKGLVLGADVEKMNDQELSDILDHTTIFARLNPDQKKRIILSLQKNGHVVGYMGDGINDAPSLRAADVGISVNNAVDVAKESADLILLKKSLEDLVEGILQGRRIFANTLKYLMMALSSNFGNMFSMAGASIFFTFLPMLPTQILFNNLLYDASQFAIPLDNVDDEYILKPRKLDMKFIKKFMYVFGSASSIFDLMTFLTLYFVFHFSGSAFQTGWFIESIATQTLVIYVIRTRLKPFSQSSPSRALVFSTLVAVLIGWVIIYTPLAKLFRFTPLALLPILAIISIVLVYLVVVELIKRQFYKKISF